MSNFVKDHSSPLEFCLIKPSDTSHISIKNINLCQKCQNKPCTFYCPTRVYSWEESLLIDYTRCIECGACPYGCPSNNINWEYPLGGFGVNYGILTSKKTKDC